MGSMAAWPTMSDYQEVLQNPKNCFSDAQLKNGSPALNPLGLPQPITGGFASVYKVATGKTNWAVRCFLHRIADIQERYALMSRYLKSRSVRTMVEFEYQQEGVRVRGAWYPILKMQWVEGETLNLWVGKHVRDRKALRKLADRWVDVIAGLERAGLSHCDLQHGNILVNSGEVTLIDYDGMFVPALAGRGSHEKGHPAYQHPQREGRDYDDTIDRFAALVIYLSLVALSEEPDLWQRFYEDDNLIFRRADFMAPDTAAVFDALEQVSDKQVVELAEALRDFCKRPLRDVPRLRDVLAGKVSVPVRANVAATPPPLPVVKEAPKPSPPPSPPPPPSKPAPPVVTGATVPGWMNPAAPKGTAAATGWVVEWARPGQMKEKHIFKQAVYGTRDVPRRFLFIPLGTKKEKFVERYEEKVEERNSTVDGHTRAVTSLAFSLDARILASGSLDRTVRVWNVSSGREACPPLEARARVVALALVPERSVAALALDDRRVLLWDFGLHRQVIHLPSPDGSKLAALAVSPDGRFVASGGSGRSFFIWSTDRGDIVEQAGGVTGRVEALAFTPDGVVVATHKGRLELFERGAKKAKWSVKTGLSAAALSVPARAGGVVLGARDGTVAFWDLKSGAETRRQPPMRGELASLAVAPDGVFLLTGLASAKARLSEIGSDREVAMLEGHGGAVTASALPGGGRCAATGAKDGAVRLWVTR